MRIVFTRLRDGGYESRVTRSDRVSYRMAGVGRVFGMPHDLAHFAVESALPLRDGFWGSIAAGAVFAGMAHVEGRRRPQAGARSALVSKANAIRLNEAEILVRLFDTAVAGNCSDRRFQAAFADRRMPPEHAFQHVTSEQIGRVREA